MLVGIMSDTHGFHAKLDTKKLNDCDVLIHAGDFSQIGSLKEIESFSRWFSKIKAKHKICIAGNHDLLLDQYADKNNKFHPGLQGSYHQTQSQAEHIIKNHNIIYLRDSEIVIDGVKFYGTPSQPPFCNWGFNDKIHLREIKFEAIPADTNVLITHCPPQGILDKTIYGDVCGCEVLKNVVTKISPKYHVFGHIHEEYGTICVNNTTFINAAIWNHYDNKFNKPVICEIVI